MTIDLYAKIQTCLRGENFYTCTELTMLPNLPRVVPVPKVEKSKSSQKTPSVHSATGNVFQPRIKRTLSQGITLTFGKVTIWFSFKGFKPRVN